MDLITLMWLRHMKKGDDSGTIPSGYIKPAGTLSITENGNYDVGSYVSAAVNVESAGGITADQIAMRTISGEIYGENATSINSYAFYSCSALTAASFPNVTNIGGNAFQGCSALTAASFPNVTKISNNAFQSCASLSIASFPVVASISNNAFTRCTMLVEFHLDNISSVPALGANVFMTTPIAGYSASTGQYGSIYVPASLYDTFLSASNWSLFASRIVSVGE